MSIIKNSPKSRADRDALGRFYTSSVVAQFVASKLTDARPTRLIDLGCGSGNLVRAALGQWPQANILTVDVDPAVESVIKTGFQGFKLRHCEADVLSANLLAVLEEDANSFDAALCNPPFVRPIWREEFAQVLSAAGFAPECLPPHAQVQADILFLAQNLRLLRDGGQLGFIAPASFVSGKHYRKFREALLAAHCVRSVVKLPRNAFPEADAKAFVVTIEKGTPTNGLIPVSNFSANGVESKAIWIDAATGGIRLDGVVEESANAKLEQASTTDWSGETLADVVTSLVRGSYKPGDTTAKATSHPLFHTTDFPVSSECPAYVPPRELCVQQAPPNVTVAGKDDILIARVGRNLHKKVCRIKDGQIVVTDNVFRIRVRPGQSERVFNALTSKAGQAWLSQTAYGVGARHITKADLLRFPVP